MQKTRHATTLKNPSHAPDVRSAETDESLEVPEMLPEIIISLIDLFTNQIQQDLLELPKTG